MKISVSLSAEDAAVLDEYARIWGLSSRSATVQRAIRLLRQADLEDGYAAAWAEWKASGDQVAWDATSGDGLADATR